MPELPEVEITKRHLSDSMAGAVLESVTLSHIRTARHNSGPAEVESRLTDRRVITVDRTGKYIHAALDDDQTMLAHLGMSGRFTINGPSEPHTHFEAILSTGDMIRFIDPRTFGFVGVLGDDEVKSSGFGRLGPDAWSSPPSPRGLMEALAGRTAPIKALLVDQRIIAGLGNIYADEVLHRAGIHPARAGGAIESREIARLLPSIREVLSSAIDKGGTSLDDLAYLLPDGRSGDNMGRLSVYGRADLPCLVCKTPIERSVIRARSTHFCPSCQT
jgi:formamidopyrimidine-DNA glycosylase